VEHWEPPSREGGDKESFATGGVKIGLKAASANPSGHSGGDRRNGKGGKKGRNFQRITRVGKPEKKELAT